MSASDWIARADSRFADRSETILVLPDGSAQRLKQSRFLFAGDDVPPRTTLQAARDIPGIDHHRIIVDTASIVGRLAAAVASLAVLSAQVIK